MSLLNEQLIAECVVPLSFTVVLVLLCAIMIVGLFTQNLIWLHRVYTVFLVAIFAYLYIFYYPVIFAREAWAPPPALLTSTLACLLVLASTLSHHQASIVLDFAIIIVIILIY